MFHGTARRVAALLTTGAAALALGGCAAKEETKGGGDGPIVVGAALDQTAYLASFDRGVRRGTELGVTQVNGKGGVAGRKLEAAFDDMKADPKQGVRSVQRLIDQRGAAVFSNGFSSAATQAEAPLAERYRKPMFAASVLPDDPAWQFSTLPAPSFETGIRMRWVKQRGIDRIGVIADSTPYNEKQLEALEKQAKEAGVEITEVVRHKADAVDLRAQVTRVLRTRPGAVLKLSAGPTHVVAAKAMAAADSDVPLLLGIEAISTIRSASAAYDQTFFAAAPPQVFDALAKSERSAPLTALVRDAPKGEDLTYVGRGYDAVLLLAEAMKRAGGTDGEKVRQALIDLPPFEGTSGTYDFTAEDHYGLGTNPLYLARVEGDAVRIVVRPEGDA